MKKRFIRPHSFRQLFFQVFLFFSSRYFYEEKNLQLGGGNRDRTCDLLNANQMLSQLSYAPKKVKLVMRYDPFWVNVFVLCYFLVFLQNHNN